MSAANIRKDNLFTQPGRLNANTGSVEKENEKGRMMVHRRSFDHQHGYCSTIQRKGGPDKDQTRTRRGLHANQHEPDEGKSYKGGTKNQTREGQTQLDKGRMHAERGQARTRTVRSLEEGQTRATCHRTVAASSH
eukprot:TRINITY_DN1977_c1_g1_i11.p2 TRINITY_DN1977_c1_g1~~TRINITY_DN1977_c1_g1_i11.p2  ORF type:complete len:135 (+),score=2.50 TRINITY_DN1977_c1_g1_i11:982-1386(+)